jgi:glycerol-3-phosphate dehydrogenase
MLLYEMMSGFKNHRFHRSLSREETLRMAPSLPVEDLIGGCLYYDAIVNDNRWTLEIVKDGVRNGGLAINHAPVTVLLKEDNKVVGVTYSDQLSGASYEARARSVVNATGVWADELRKLDRPDVTNLVRLSKGTHLVLAEGDVPLMVSLIFLSPVDRRPLFLIKREGCFLYGTTDDWEDTEPGSPMPSQEDVEYLLESLRQFMPDAQLDLAKVQFVYSGFRPLLSTNGQNSAPSSVSREDVIEVAPSGLITVVGGKLTTARLIAIRVLDCVTETMNHAGVWSPCLTHKLPIGGANEEVAEGFAYWVQRCPQLAGSFRTLYQRYGIDANTICAEAMKTCPGEHPDSRAELICAEIQYICRNEMVCTLEDLVERRAGFLHWNNETRLERLRHGARVIRDELDMSEEEFEGQCRNYREYLKRSHTLPEQAKCHMYSVISS